MTLARQNIWKREIFCSEDYDGQSAQSLTSAGAGETLRHRFLGPDLQISARYLKVRPFLDIGKKSSIILFLSL